MVQVISTQNETWQGTVTWADGKQTKPFRSALELIRLIDSTLEGRTEREAEVEAQ